MKNTILLKSLIVFFAFSCITNKSFPQRIAITAYTAGLTSPIDIKNCGDNRLFVAERAGKIRVINEDSTLRPTPFLDITSKIPSVQGEEGLLGFAFSPNYKADGKLYVNYVGVQNSLVTSFIEEYKVNAGDSNVADLSSSLTILMQQQPVGLTNHKGGNMMFGKDGYLYISFGDGGGAGDPSGNGQNKNTFLGKILRIDVSNSSAAQPYVIPPTNPLYNDATPGVKKEIWAYGVRNPFRCSIDRLTGDVWIADVGQGNLEEIDLQRSGTPLNPNFGWNIMEGSACYNPSTGCATAGIKLPLYEYSHAVGQSIIGGYLYRSAQSKALFGMYLYADYVQKWIDGFRQNDDVVILPVQRLRNGTDVPGNPISFGEDRYGDQYILFDGNNTVYKISDTSYLRRPKAWFAATLQNGSGYTMEGLQGFNLTYQWLKDGIAIPGATGPDYVPAMPGTYRFVVTNTLNFSDTSDPYVLGALSVRLTNFAAKRTDEKQVLLQWITPYDQDTKGYTVQKKTGNETVFSNVAFLPSKDIYSASSAGVQYLFTDSAADRNAVIFYRLSIQNKNGSTTYSDIRMINGNNKNRGFYMYPNPAKNSVSINLASYTEPVKVVIYDYLGKKVREQNVTQQVSNIPLPGLSGVYTIILRNAAGKNIAKDKLLIIR